MTHPTVARILLATCATVPIHGPFWNPEGKIGIYIGIFQTHNTVDGTLGKSKIAILTCLGNSSEYKVWNLVNLLEAVSCQSVQYREVDPDNSLPQRLREALQQVVLHHHHQQCEPNPRIGLSYDPTSGHSTHALTDTEELRMMKIKRVDAKEITVQPITTLKRDFVYYVVEDGVVLAIEKKRSHNAMRYVNNDLGMSQEGTVLEGVNEWRTWIYTTMAK